MKMEYCIRHAHRRVAFAGNMLVTSVKQHVVCFSQAFRKLFLTANVIQSDTKICSGKTICLEATSGRCSSSEMWHLIGLCCVALFGPVVHTPYIIVHCAFAFLAAFLATALSLPDLPSRKYLPCDSVTLGVLLVWGGDWASAGRKVWSAYWGQQDNTTRCFGTTWAEMQGKRKKGRKRQVAGLVSFRRCSYNRAYGPVRAGRAPARLPWRLWSSGRAHLCTQTFEAAITASGCRVVSQWSTDPRDVMCSFSDLRPRRQKSGEGVRPTALEGAGAAGIKRWYTNASSISFFGTACRHECCLPMPPKPPSAIAHWTTSNNQSTSSSSFPPICMQGCVLLAHACFATNMTWTIPSPLLTRILLDYVQKSRAPLQAHSPLTARRHVKQKQQNSTPGGNPLRYRWLELLL